MISVVVPSYNEASSLPDLVRQIDDVMASRDEPYELIVVDDGSTDDTSLVLGQLRPHYAPLRHIRLARNFGKAAALQVGFRAATGRHVVTLDADLQDRPSEIPKLLSLIAQGHDVVSGWKRRRQDPFGKRFLSLVFNKVVSWTSGVRLHDHNCGLKAYRAEALRQIKLYGQMHRFIPIILAAQGYRVAECVVEHSPRAHGKSKYGWSRVYKGWLDFLTVFFLTRFRHNPLHFFGALGSVAILVGGGGLMYLAALWLAGNGLAGRPLMMYSAATLIIGVQLFGFGLLAELMTSYLTRSDEYVAHDADHAKVFSSQARKAAIAGDIPVSEVTWDL